MKGNLLKRRQNFHCGTKTRLCKIWVWPNLFLLDGKTRIRWQRRHSKWIRKNICYQRIEQSCCSNHQAECFLSGRVWKVSFQLLLQQEGRKLWDIVGSWHGVSKSIFDEVGLSRFSRQAPKRSDSPELNRRTGISLPSQGLPVLREETLSEFSEFNEIKILLEWDGVFASVSR